VTDQLVSLGLRDAGFVYVNLDDCWMNHYRDNVTGELTASAQNFPNGMKALGDMIHGKGLKYGLYSDRGFRTCQGFPGLLDNEELDAKTMAGFGIDFFKNDGCYTTSPADEGDGGVSGNNMPDPSAYPHYLKMHQALAATGRDIIHNVKGVPGGGCSASDGRAVSNMRRCGSDIGDSFGSAVGEFMTCAENGDPNAGPVSSQANLPLLACD
jgi:alpha-galactosidase